MEYRNGPDQIVPATHFKTSKPNGAVVLLMEKSGPNSLPPISIYTFVKRAADSYKNSCTVAKAFIKLGLECFHGVCIMGFNSPEWLLANFGAIFARGFSAGVYTTNSPEACQHVANNCAANILVVEDTVCLNKFLAVKRFLPSVKAIIQWTGEPGAPGVISWAELMAIGLAEDDTALNERLSLTAVNQCCVLIYTSGTTGFPKAVMCSNDHLTWIMSQYRSALEYEIMSEVFISYLPLSHLAGQSLDIYFSCDIGGTVYFAQPDALKGTLGETLLEVQPTGFLGVPRVYEKIYERMQEVGAKVGSFKKVLANWAKYHGLNYYEALREGRDLTTYEAFCYYLAKTLIFNKIKEAMGLQRAKSFISGAAPISKDILDYFLSIDISITEGYGLSESLSLGSVGVVKPHQFKTGSVGKTFPSIEIKLDETKGRHPGEGEIWIKGRNIFMGYLHMQEQTDEAIDNQGWLHTGDLGWFDDEGFLYITGRIKELIITSGGENIPPYVIESIIKKELPIVSNVFLVGDKRKYLTVLLTLKCEMDNDTGEPLDILNLQVLEWMNLIQFTGTTVTSVVDELKRNPNGPVRNAIQAIIDRYNSQHAMSNAHKVQKWTVLPHDFSIPTGELNNTLKVKRSFVVEKYSDVIEKMYESNNTIASKL